MRAGQNLAAIPSRIETIEEVPADPHPELPCRNAVDDRLSRIALRREIRLDAPAAEVERPSDSGRCAVRCADNEVLGCLSGLRRLRRSRDRREQQPCEESFAANEMTLF